MSKPSKKKNIVQDQSTSDGLNNFTAKLGLQAENLSSLALYTYGNLLSRQHVTLEMIYRTSWIAGQVVDTVAEDMTKEGINMYSKMSPDHSQVIQSKMTELSIWKSLCNTIKWSRLYGGAIAVIITEGADYEKPLEIEKIGRNKFKGLVVFDRWQLEPSFNDLITELGFDMGMPKYYTILPSMESMSGIKVHHSRCIRLDGVEMPYWQKKMDNLWGMSVIERMYDRLLAFDSATQGAAQLLYKAYLRVVQIEGLRQALAMGGKTEQAVIKQFEYIRLMQTNEGITLLDKNDSFTAHNYSFSGVSDVLMQFGQQISGATGIPLVRLFGQSPAGLSSTGESDLRNYYDHIGKLQEANLRLGVRKILEVMSVSCFGEPLPNDFEFDFASLWQPSELEKSQVATSDAQGISTLFQSGILTKKISMKELAQQSRTTGRFTNITDEDIAAARESAPEHTRMPEENAPIVQPGINQKIDIEAFKKKLKELKNKEPEQDNKVPEQTLNKLEKDLKDLISLEQLEDELAKINSGEKTLSQLSEELRRLGVNKNSIEDLERKIEELPNYVPPKKMIADAVINKKSFLDAVKKFFGGVK